MSLVRIVKNIRSKWIFIGIWIPILFFHAGNLKSNIITFDEPRYVELYYDTYYRGGPETTIIDQVMGLNFYIAYGEMYIERRQLWGITYNYFLSFDPFLNHTTSADPTGRVVITFDDLQSYVRVEVETDGMPVHPNAYLRVSFYSSTSPNNPLYSEDGAGNVEHTDAQNGIKMVIVETKYTENNIIELEFYDLEEPEEPDPPSGLVALSGYNEAIPIAWHSPISNQPADPPPTVTPEVSHGQMNRNQSANSYISALNLQSYKIFRSTSLNGTYSQIASNITKQYYRDETVSNGQAYYYKVKAVYDGGESDFSNAANATPQSNGNIISSGWAASGPILDGVINAGEWSSASQTVFTFPGSSDNVTLYVMNNDSYVYFAVDDEGNTSLDDNDTFGILFDENYDREWPSTNTGEEGILQLFWNAGSPASAFQSLFGTWPVVYGSSWSTPSGIDLGMSATSGNLQIEARLNLSTSPFNVSAGDVLGVLFYTFDGASGFTGVWPQETEERLSSLTSAYTWAHGPFAYGDLKLTDEEPEEPEEPAGNMISNWSFSDGMTDWDFVTMGSGNGTGTVESGVFHAQIQNGGSNTWDVKLHQYNLTIVNGFIYTATFYARAASPRNMKAYVGQSSTPYDIFNINNIFSLTTDWQTYTFTFTMNYPTENGTALIGFDLGTSDVDVYLDNISLVQTGSTDVPSDKNARIIRTFELSQNYPNPFNPVTTIRFQVPQPCLVSLKIFDILGNEVAELVNEKKTSGIYSAEWNGKAFPSGLYIVRLRAGEYTETRKLVLQK